MKRTILVIVLIAGVIGGGITLMQSETISYETQIVEKEIIKEVNPLNERIGAAQEAERERLEQEAQAAYDRSMQKGLTEIELTITRQYRAEIEEREVQLEETVSF